MDIKKALGNRVRTLRTQRNLTQDELSEMIERSVDGLSLIERGQNWPSADTVERLADAFNIDPTDLFDGLSISQGGKHPDAFAVANDTLRRISKKDLPFAAELLEALERKGRGVH